MRRLSTRMRVSDTGQFEIIDPGLDDVELLQSVNGGFAVRSATLPGFKRPRLHGLRGMGAGLCRKEAERLPLVALWAAHNGAAPDRPCAYDEIDILALKALIAQRLLQSCVLCARRCGVNRLAGQKGACGLLDNAFVAECFVHVAEEAFINPSLCLNLRGCALRCRGCQQYRLLDPRAPQSEALLSAFWSELELSGARSLSFVGGNPDESIAAILRFLMAAPDDFRLPIVWNNNAYMSQEVVRLLDGVIDCYTPDLKFHRDQCAARYTGAPDYAAVAQAAIAALAASGAPVIVRILLMPGHVACCHAPSLEWLAELQCNHLYVSIRDQYAPDWRITERDGALARRVSKDEVAMARASARALGLNMID